MVPVANQGVEKGMVLLYVLVVSPLLPPATNEATKKTFVEIGKAQLNANIDCRCRLKASLLVVSKWTRTLSLEKRMEEAN